MKKIFVWMICTPSLLALMACKSSTEQQGAIPPSADSMAVARLDSARQHDPYERYSFMERQGKALFDHYCAVCHGTSGQGDGFNSYNLEPRPHSFTDSSYTAMLSDATLAEVIARGGRGVNRSVLMPAYIQTLSAYQIDQVVAYLRTFTNLKSTD